MRPSRGNPLHHVISGPFTAFFLFSRPTSPEVISAHVDTLLSPHSAPLMFDHREVAL